jgi:preprotein translocase subunit SecG
MDSRLFCVPLVVWALAGVFIVWRTLLIQQYRKRGLIPPSTVQSQFDLVRGKFDHLPKMRGLRRAVISLAVLFMVSAVVVVAINSRHATLRNRLPAPKKSGSQSRVIRGGTEVAASRVERKSSPPQCSFIGSRASASLHRCCH